MDKSQKEGEKKNVREVLFFFVLQFASSGDTVLACVFILPSDA